MGQDENFDVFEFDDEPDFGVGADDDLLNEIANQQDDGEGISRTFRIVFLFIMLAVVAIVILIIVFVIGSGGGDEITDAEASATSAIRTNTAVAIAFERTVQAIEESENATATREVQLTQTAVSAEQTAIANQTATQEALNLTATADFFASQTAVAITATAGANQTATAEVFANQTATETALRVLRGEVVNSDTGQTYEGIPLRLYRDDGDGEFDPVQPLPSESQPEDTGEAGDTAGDAGGEAGGDAGDEENPFTVVGPSGGDSGGQTGGQTGEAGDSGATVGDTGDTGDFEVVGGEDEDAESPDAPAAGEDSDVPADGEALPINYGETVAGVVEVSAADLWAFSGSAGDTVIITTSASNAAQTDLFVRLLDANGAELAFNDDANPGDSNAVISGFELPADGVYTISITTNSAPGAYTLSLEAGLTGSPEAEPTQESVSIRVDGQSGIVLAGFSAPVAAPARRQGPTPTPEQGGDEPVDVIITGPGGTFDFGSLPPGDYWLVIDPADLPPDLQAGLVPGQPVVVFVQVPVGGDFDVVVVGPTSTAIPSVTPNPVSLTLTARYLTQTVTPGGPTATEPVGGLVTLTPTEEGPDNITPVTNTPATMPDTGIFDEISGGDNDIEGSSGLVILAIAAFGLGAVVFVARRLRTNGDSNS